MSNPGRLGCWCSREAKGEQFWGCPRIFRNNPHVAFSLGRGSLEEKNGPVAQAIRKAPQTSNVALGFKLAASKLAIVVELLMGGVPERWAALFFVGFPLVARLFFKCLSPSCSKPQLVVGSKSKSRTPDKSGRRST